MKFILLLACVILGIIGIGVMVLSLKIFEDGVMLKGAILFLMGAFWCFMAGYLARGVQLVMQGRSINKGVK